MGKEGSVTEIYTGNRRFTGRCDFTQGGFGLGIQVVKDSNIYYVDVNKTGPASSGDGLSWDEAFVTATEGVDALGDYDVLMLGPGNHDELTKLTLSGLKGVKIFGTNTGMTWGEGSTCIRDVSHTVADDLLDLTGCQSVEIAGVSFVCTSAKDAINFTPSLSYGTEIHDCCFVGNVGGTDKMVYGVNIGESNGPDTYIHHCKFDRIATAAILGLGQRNVVEHNVFIVSNAGKGIHGVDASGVPAFNIIRYNDFLGHATDGYGIYDAGGTAGNFLISENRFAGFNTTKQINVAAAADANCINNYMHGTNGAITVANPSP